VHCIGSVSKKLHLVDKPARPRLPFVLLESRGVAIATQQRCVAKIISERNHSAYDGFRIPPGHDQTRVRATYESFGQGQRCGDHWDPTRPVLDHLGRQATAKVGQVVEKAEAGQRTADACQRRLTRQEPVPSEDALLFGLTQRLSRFPLRRFADDLEPDRSTG